VPIWLNMSANDPVSQGIPVGCSSNSADANSYCLASGNALLSHAPAAPIRTHRSVTKHHHVKNAWSADAAITSNTVASVQIAIAHLHR
jgi:hypothetical protein